MKKIAILLALSMMLAGCTELEELVDTLDETYTTQDLDGIYHGSMLAMRVSMNADDTYDIYLLEMRDCLDSASEAQSEVDEMNAMSNNDDTNGEESSATYVVIDDVCIAEEGLLVNEDGTTFTSELDSSSAIPTLTVVISEAYSQFECDDGDTIDGDWVGDGDDDCAGGEDEVAGAEDDVTTENVVLATAYLAADGYGVIGMTNDGLEDEIICMVLSPTGVSDLIMEAMMLLEDAEENGVEIDLEDESTIPEDVALLFAVHELAYSLSPASSIAVGCEDTTFLYSSVLFYIWASSLAEPVDDGGFMMYGFDVIDASSETPTSTAGEDLVYAMMTQGDDLNWAEIIVQLSVNGGAFIECTQPGQSADTSCHVTGNGDTYWGVGEEVTISEGSDDLCSGPCDVQIKILNAVDNKLIYESTTVYVE